MGQAQREPRNAVEAWRSALSADAVQRMDERAERLFLPNDSNPKSSTTGYVACIFMEDGEPTTRYWVGKPVGSGDCTKKGGGPYSVDIKDMTCNCPSFKDKEVCKHLAGLVKWKASHKIELLPIKGVTNRMLVKWLEV